MYTLTLTGGGGTFEDKPSDLCGAVASMALSISMAVNAKRSGTAIVRDEQGEFVTGIKVVNGKSSMMTGEDVG
jgi:hypothetical protein